MWQQIPISQNMTWEEAIEYCENLELAGYDDWRIPTAKELFGLSDFEIGWPFIDTDFFEFPEQTIAPPDNANSGPQDGGSKEGAPQGGAEGTDKVAGQALLENNDAESAEGQMSPPPSDEATDDGSVSKAQGQFWSSNFYIKAVEVKF